MAQDKRIGTVTIEGARIIFRNFTGREGQYNREGDRNFGVVLDPNVAEQMLADGWNVKYLKPREEGEEPTPWIQVSVSYKGRPPRVVMVTSRGRTALPEELVEALDYADLENVDLILNPYEWGPINGKFGVKAYLKSIFVTIQEDDLERKYADVPEIDFNGRPLAIESSHMAAIEGGDDIIEGEVIED